MVPSTKEISSSVDNIVKQSEYLSEVINNFKDFFYHNSNKVTQINIINSVNKIETIIKDSFFDNNIKYISDIEDCEILGNENTLTQALLNIYNNAFEAIISKTKSSKNRYFFVTLKKYDDQVKLTFKDSGGGISPHIINKVFEPYFSTKHASVGTGISLYMTHQLITKQLKGNITLHNSNYTYNDQKLKGIEVIITFNI
jgi:signal transduction histidine kinase